MMTMMYKVIRLEKEATMQGLEEEDDYITTEEALKLLNLKSKNRLYQLRRENIIDFFQHGRRAIYSRKSIIAYIQAHKISKK